MEIYSCEIKHFSWYLIRNVYDSVKCTLKLLPLNLKALTQLLAWRSPRGLKEQLGFSFEALMIISNINRKYWLINVTSELASWLMAGAAGGGVRQAGWEVESDGFGKTQITQLRERERAIQENSKIHSLLNYFLILKKVTSLQESLRLHLKLIHSKRISSTGSFFRLLAN